MDEVFDILPSDLLSSLGAAVSIGAMDSLLPESYWAVPSRGFESVFSLVIPFLLQAGNKIIKASINNM